MSYIGIVVSAGEGQHLYALILHVVRWHDLDALRQFLREKVKAETVHEDVCRYVIYSYTEGCTFELKIVERGVPCPRRSEGVFPDPSEPHEEDLFPYLDPDPTPTSPKHWDDDRKATGTLEFEDLLPEIPEIIIDNPHLDVISREPILVTCMDCGSLDDCYSKWFIVPPGAVDAVLTREFPDICKEKCDLTEIYEKECYKVSTAEVPLMSNVKLDW